MSSSRRALLKNNKLLALALGLICLAGQASAEESLSAVDWLGASGSLRPSYWNRDTSYSNQRDYLAGSAWLTLRPKEVEGFKGYFDGYIYGQDFSRKSDSIGELREGYVEKSIGHFDFKVGRQITVWGRADKVNPTDNLSVRDYTRLMTDDEDQRIGVFATQAVYNFDRFRLIGIWQPEWRSPTYPIQPLSGISFQDVKPENSSNNFGFKIDSSGGSTDWSLSYFDGFNKTPDLSVLSAGQNILLGLNHRHIQVYGGDFAHTLGDYGVRGEIAYTKTDDSSGNDPLIQNSNVFATLGADRSFVDTFNINAQVMYRNVLNFQDPSSISDPTTRTLAEQQAKVTNQKYAEQFGATLRPSYKAFNETLEIEVAVVTWFKNGDSLLRPKVTYAFTDHLKGIIGGTFYSGPSDTFFGQLKDISSVFTEVRYLF